jgi:hypothetical protein
MCRLRCWLDRRQSFRKTHKGRFPVIGKTQRLLGRGPPSHAFNAFQFKSFLVQNASITRPTILARSRAGFSKTVVTRLTAPASRHERTTRPISKAKV